MPRIWSMSRSMVSATTVLPLGKVISVVFNPSTSEVLELQPHSTSKRRRERGERLHHTRIVAIAQVSEAHPPDARNDQVRALGVRAAVRAHRGAAGLARCRIRRAKCCGSSWPGSWWHGRRRARPPWRSTACWTPISTRRNPRTRIAPSARRSCSRAASPGASSRSGRWCFCSRRGELNPLCFKLAPVALAIVMFYSFTKRFTSLSHLVLGFSLGIAPAAAWIAMRGSLDPRILWLTAAVTLWTAGFDIIYSCQDYEFDVAGGPVQHPAAVRHRRRAVDLARCCTWGCWPAWWCWCSAFALGALALAGIAAVAALLAVGAPPGAGRRPVARRRGLLHHERLRQRDILCILGRRYLLGLICMTPVFEDPRLRADPRQGRGRRAAVLRGRPDAVPHSRSAGRRLDGEPGARAPARQQDLLQRQPPHQSHRCLRGQLQAVRLRQAEPRTPRPTPCRSKRSGTSAGEG